MSTHEYMQAQSEVSPPSMARGVIQRKCDCGTHTFGGGKCDACGKEQGVLQRRKARGTETSGARQTVPQSVRDVVGSPGRPLDTSTRALMESRFGHDFSHVRIHTDTRAAESSEAVNAHAYTLGSHITFGAGRYAPETTEGRRLLGHELTHVLQQTASRGAASSSGAHAEQEAEQNGLRLVAGHAGLEASAAPSGTLQLDEKDEEEEKKGGEKKGEDKPSAATTFSGERTGTKKGEEKFSVKAETTLPLTDELSFGSLAFLDDLKLTASGDVLGQPLGLTTLSSDFKLKMALTLMKLELESVKSKADALKKGKLSFGATLGTSGGLTMPFNKFDPTGSLGLTLDTKAAATSASLIPASRGKLTFGASLSAGGSLTNEISDVSAPFIPKAESKLGLGFDFESASSSNRFLTFGGALGDKARVTAGLESGASGSLTEDKTSGGLSFGASLGLTGERKGVERFVKIQFTTDVTADYEHGTATTKTQSSFLGFITTGFKFGGGKK
ncbi:MAG TPA: DUF4157 domain-containing protein [Pyrinomonadaceae bacterium]|nr:DUF4157 domain-containing protein [Pyrinomonadaceae bacterium]